MHDLKQLAMKAKEERSDGRACKCEAAIPSVEEMFDVDEKSWSSSSSSVAKHDRRKEQIVVADMEGTITRSKWPFAYYMLVALNAGSVMRGLILLMLSPLIRLVQAMGWEAGAMRMLIFVSTAGLKAKRIERVGRAVLCRFYLEDLKRQGMRGVMACGRRWVVTGMAREMVEPFLRDYMGAEKVMATELHKVKGGDVCTGLVLTTRRRDGGAGGGGLLWGAKKRMEAVMEAAARSDIDVGIANEVEDETGFLTMCKERYMVRRNSKQEEEEGAMMSNDEYPKPLIFHDGRLVQRPTEFVSLFLFLWIPIGIALAVTRMLAWMLLPRPAALPVLAFLGLRVRVKGAPPPPDAADSSSGSGGGRLYICTHKTVVDGMMCSIAARKKLAAAIYSVSPWVEALTPMPSVRLLRHRSLDSLRLRRALLLHDLFLCPEGTTCREPFLLRFSPLFAELSPRIVPVGIDVRQSLFFGNTASGNKILDPTFFFMNPSPLYFLHLLDPLPDHMTCAGGKTSLEVANAVQELLGRAMGFRCTQLTRKHKYLLLAGNDGVDPQQHSKMDKDKEKSY